MEHRSIFDYKYWRRNRKNSKWKFSSHAWQEICIFSRSKLISQFDTIRKGSIIFRQFMDIAYIQMSSMNHFPRLTLPREIDSAYDSWKCEIYWKSLIHSCIKTLYTLLIWISGDTWISFVLDTFCTRNWLNLLADKELATFFYTFSISLIDSKNESYTIFSRVFLGYFTHKLVACKKSSSKSMEMLT